MTTDPGGEAYERAIEARFAPLDYPSRHGYAHPDGDKPDPTPVVHGGDPCACGHYHETDDVGERIRS